MKKLFAILLLLPVLSQAQIISGKEFRFVPKTQPTYMAYPGDSSVLMIDRATGKFRRTHIAGGGGGAVSSVFGRTGNVVAIAGDYQSFYPQLSQSYFNPSWINKIAQSKIINQNTFSQVSSNFNSYIFEQKNASFFEAGYRDGGGALTINGPTGDTILFAGGWTSPATVYDSVFYSVDGGTTKVFLWLAPWGAMHSFGFFQGDDGFYYKIGGDYLSSDAQKRAVWRSGTPTVRSSWSQVGTLPGMATILFGCADLNGTIYKFGGQKTVNWSDGATDTVWKSIDNGVNWIYHSHGSGLFNKNISGCITKGNGKVYIVAGGRYDEATPGNRTFEKTVYETSDFITYRQLPSLPTDGVQYPSVAFYDNRLFLLAGYNGTANTNSVVFLDGTNNWYVAPNYDSSRFAISTTHASAITVWRDKIVLMNGNNFNKTYWLKRSRFFTNSTGDLTFLNPISTDTITTNPLTGITYFGSKYSGAWVELFNVNGILNRVYSKRNFWVDNQKITIGNSSQSAAQIWMEISGNPNNVIETNANGIDFFHANTLYWRFQYNGPFRMREIADPGTPPTSHGFIYPSTDGKLYYENNGLGKYDLTGRSFPIFSTDTAYSIAANDIYIICDEITANRVLTLPAAASNPGRVVKIWNKNSAAFIWSFSTAVKDASSADVTNLTNDTWYHLISDGTNWIIEN